MAGHSKWANIKHRKNRQDAKRGKIFTKHIKAITVAAQLGGIDPDQNPRLKLAITKALSDNMTRDAINRTLKKVAGDNDAARMEEILYEGYGPGGVAVMVECLTDNRNRTVGEVRHAFTKHGGNLGTSGSVAYLFNKQGLITFAPGVDEEKILEIALEAGADDVTSFDDGSLEIQTLPEHFQAVYDRLTAQSFNPEQAEIAMIATTQIPLDKETSEKLLKLQDHLEDLEDVQEVHTNADIDVEML